MQVVYGCLLIILGQLGVFLQTYAWPKIPFLKPHKWLLYGLSIPIGLLFIKGISLVVAGTGANWPSKFATFVTGIVVFAVLNRVMFNEVLTMKTAICLLLCAAIVGIQMFWKQ